MIGAKIKVCCRLRCYESFSFYLIIILSRISNLLLLLFNCISRHQSCLLTCIYNYILCWLIFIQDQLLRVNARPYFKLLSKYFQQRRVRDIHLKNHRQSSESLVYSVSDHSIIIASISIPSRFRPNLLLCYSSCGCNLNLDTSLSWAIKFNYRWSALKTIRVHAIVRILLNLVNLL